MADITMTVVELARDLIDMEGHASVELGNAPGTDDFLMPNDGKTLFLVNGVTGDTFTFAAVNCEHGRTETLALVVAAGDVALIGPFPQALWNNGDNQVRITPTAWNVGDFLLAVKLP
jgi:hypothetical protein